MPRRRRAVELVLTCEHATNSVPARYRAAFAGAGRVLESHRAWDPGALPLARELARSLRAPLVAGRATRLLVDPNRSLHHRTVFSEWSRGLPAAERERLVADLWQPHRRAVEALLRERVAAGAVAVHVAVHSFTPRLAGRVRDVDVGLLFDPRRALEVELGERWRDALRARNRKLRVRRNAPYRGWADGLTTTLRGLLPEERYVGLELEVSQRFPSGAPSGWSALRGALLVSLRETLSAFPPA